ncbi:MAG: hypothetical protein F6K48_10450 [Okeania sp. SIO3H1]|uniref:hypothetical protein n=1 Tax=Okeania sp. SIO1I7 TaxID=2607772 RepID=UPI0013C79CA9|nr:hypothetical protein [Okeania sp. SIO1I7]NEN89290.1 hypothetical protein [Okeania sp. SIO3H1]NET27526.1 hypothetical protein [Okeania sp. SIO1I7]
MKKIQAKKNKKINQVENGLVVLQEHELESVVGGFLPPDLEDLMNKSKENPTSPSIESNRWRNLA